MAGNNLIQFLRGTNAQISSSQEVANAGQHMFSTDDKYLLVGDDSTQIRNLEPILGTTGPTGPSPTGSVSVSVTGFTKYIPNSGNLQLVPSFVGCVGLSIKYFPFGDSTLDATVTDVIFFPLAQIFASPTTHDTNTYQVGGEYGVNI